MDFLKGFLTNLVVLILLVVVLDLLLPESSFRKYTKLVIGLIFVSILLSPIFQLFRTDFSETIESGIAALTQNDQYSFTNQLESKKSEINLSNRAYILEQMAEKLKRDAEEELMTAFQYKIVKVEIEIKDQSGELKTENIQQINVQLEETSSDLGTSTNIEPVEEIDIRKGTPVIAGNRTKKENEISTWLSNRWGTKDIAVHVMIGA